MLDGVFIWESDATGCADFLSDLEGGVTARAVTSANRRQHKNERETEYGN
jgi:hypothetical protein